MKKFFKMACLILTTMALTLGISTVSSARTVASQETAAAFLKGNGMLQGDENGDLMLEKPLKREQMMVIVSRMLGVEQSAKMFPTDGMTFRDIPLESEYSHYLAWAQASKITEGYSQEEFGFNDPLTGWQTKAFFVRTLGYTNISDKSIDELSDKLGITMGLKVDQVNPILRGNVAVMMYNTLQSVNKSGDKLGEVLGVIPQNGTAQIINGQWLYFINAEDSNKIYRMKIDGTEKTKVNDNASSSLFLSNGWIYYNNLDAGRKIYKVNPQSMKNVKLTDTEADIIDVDGTWVYYVEQVESNIQKVSVDGTKTVKLNDVSSSYGKLIGNKIYYINLNDFAAVYSVDTDGTNNAKVDYEPYSVAVDKDWIYFSSLDKKLYKTNILGTDSIKLLDNGRSKIQIYNNNIYSISGSKDHYMISFPTSSNVNENINTDNGTSNGSTIVNTYTPFKEVSRDFADNYEISGDYIIFINKSQNDKLNKVKIGEEKLVSLSDDSVDSFKVSGEWIYYVNRNDGGRIYKIKIDGTERTKLNDNSSGIIGIADGKLYYINKNDISNIYRINADGTNNEKFTSFDWRYSIFENGWIYYVDLVNDGSILKMKNDGKVKQNLTHGAGLAIVYNDGFIYYTDVKDDYSIYKVPINGGKSMRVTYDSGITVKVENDWVYFRNFSDNGKLYRLKTDGTGRTQLEF